MSLIPVFVRERGRHSGPGKGRSGMVSPMTGSGRMRGVPIISQLVRHPAFLSEVVEAVRREVLGALIHGHGVEGAVTGYRLTEPLEFQRESCVGTACTIGFSGMGEVEGTGPGPDTDSPVTFLTRRPLVGCVDAAWPEGAEAGTPEEFEALYPSMAFDVRVESAGLEED